MICYKTALITGASSGLGAEIARRLAMQGACCKTPVKRKIDDFGAVCAKNASKARFCSLPEFGNRFQGIELILSSQNPTDPDWIACDLSKTREPLLKKIRERAPDLIINNAGFTVYGECLDQFEAQQKIFAVNALAPFELSLEAAKTLKEKGLRGTIINISSAASFFVFPCLASYTAAKAFIASFSQSLDEEMRPFGIRVLTCLPGQIATPFASRAAGRPAQRKALAMSVEKAAELILRQIASQNPYQVIDWRSRLGVLLSHFVSKSFLAKRLKQELLSRL